MFPMGPFWLKPICVGEVNPFKIPTQPSLCESRWDKRDRWSGETVSPWSLALRNLGTLKRPNRGRLGKSI